jgi:hypothetical protein
MKNENIKKARWLIVGVAVLVIALISVVAVMALSLSPATVPIKGNVTVPTSPPPPPVTTSGNPAVPNFALSSDAAGTNLLTATSNIDFSSTATDYNGGFSKVVTVYIENTGTNGTGSYLGASATINELPVTLTDSGNVDSLAITVTYGAPAAIGSEVAGTSSTFTALPVSQAEALTITLTGTVMPNTSDTAQLLEALPTATLTFSPS